MEPSSIIISNNTFLETHPEADIVRKSAIVGGWLFFMIVTVVGNLLVMVAYAKDKKIREYVPNLIILHLSIADFLVGVFSLTPPIAYHLNNDSLLLGEYECKMLLIVDHVAVVLSMAMMLCISFDRYWVVKKNIHYRSFQTRGRVKKMIAASWILIVATYSFMILGWDLLPWNQVEVQFYDTGCQPSFIQSLLVVLILSSLTGYIPLLTIAILNTLIFIHLWRNSKVFQKVKLPSGRHFTVDSGQAQTEDQRKVNERKVYSISAGKDNEQRPQDKLRDLELRFRQNVSAAVKLAVLVAAFAICWIPLEIAGLYSLHCGDCIRPVIFRSLAALQYFNSCLNPFLYAATNKRFKDNFKRFLNVRRCCSMIRRV